MSHVIVIAPTAATAHTAWAYLQNVGLTPAQPSRREQLTPQQVQALMIKTTQQHRSPQSAALDKIWTELATDLALGNVDAQRCGWWQTLDPHTPAFWQRFDPDTRFVLVYEDPTAQTAQALTDTLERDTTPTSGTAADIASTLQAWYDQHSQLLDAFFALGADAQLVHTTQLAQAAQWLGLSAHGTESPPAFGAFAEAPTPDAGLLHHLLQPLVAAHPAVQSLWPQLQAAAQGPCPDPAPKQQATRQAVCQWLQLQHQSKATGRRLEQIAQHNEQLQTRLGDQAAALQTESTAKAHAQQQLQTLQKAQEHEQEQNKRQLKEAQEEGELLLAQLHQVQEELESHFLKLQEETQAKAELQAQLTAESQAKEAEAAAKVAIQQQVQTLQQEQERQKRQLREAQEEGELLLVQLHQVQEELEQYFLKYQEQRQQYQTVADFWRQHPPAEVWVDMRRTPDGAGWYEAEADGRWSGPATESTVALPPLAAGDYLLELHIADAMAPELVAGLQLSAVLNDGQNEPAAVPVELVHEFGPADNLYPMVSTGLLALPATQAGWQLRLTLPEVISPAAHGGSDTRHLGLRLQGLRLSLHTPVDVQASAQAEDPAVEALA